MAKSSFKGLENQLESDLPGALGFVGKVIKSLSEDSPIEHKELPAKTDIHAWDKFIVTYCSTCDNKGKLGNPGYEIDCPFCKRKCPTCGGSGKLGNSNPIPCPICTK